MAFEKKEKEVKKKNEFGSVSDALKFIRSTYGKESIVSNEKMNLPSYSTGSIGLDYAVGNGGFAKGRIIELFGSESSGKTTIACEVGKNVQKEKAVLYVDFEHAIDLLHAKKDLGLDLNENKFVFAQPDCFEDGMNIICELVNTGLFGLVVVDSVAAMSPRAEIEGEMDDKTIGLQARLMGQAIRKLMSMLNKTNTLCIFINQIRDKIGGHGGTTTPGGKALKFFASTRVNLYGRQVEGGMVEVEAKVVKNKVAPAMRTCEFKINKYGVMSEYELIERAIKFGYIKKKGSWFEFGKLHKAQGTESISQFLKANTKILGKLKDKIFELMEAENEASTSQQIDESLKFEVEDNEIDKFLSSTTDSEVDIDIEENEIKETKKEKKKKEVSVND